MAHGPATKELAKPPPWNVEGALVDPAFQHLWLGLKVGVMWHDPNTGVAANFVTREIGTIDVGTHLGVARPLGDAMQPQGTSGHLDIPFAVDPAAVADGLTAVVVHHADSNASDDQILLHQHDGSGSAGRLYFQYDGAANEWFTFMGGSGLFTSGASINVGGMNMVALRHPGGTGTLRLGMNGDWTNATASRTLEASDGDHTWMGHKNTSDTGDTVPGYCFYIWERELSDADLDLIYQDPFGIVRPNWDYIVASAVDPTGLQASVSTDDISLSWDA